MRRKDIVVGLRVVPSGRGFTKNWNLSAYVGTVREIGQRYIGVQWDGFDYSTSNLRPVHLSPTNEERRAVWLSWCCKRNGNGGRRPSGVAWQQTKYLHATLDGETTLCHRSIGSLTSAKEDRPVCRICAKRVVRGEYAQKPSPPNDVEDKFRSRWRRWLGNKTRCDGPYWTTLLDSNWIGWAYNVLGDDARPVNLIGIDRERVKALWLKAINQADMKQLRRLDALYAAEKIGLL